MLLMGWCSQLQPCEMIGDGEGGKGGGEKGYLGVELDGHVLPPLNPPCVSGGVRVIFEVQDGVVPEEESDSPPLDDEGLILLMIDPAVSCLPYHLLDGADDPPLML